MNIKQLQEHLPWGAHTYSPAFLAGVDHNHFGHALLHIHKAAGKLAGMVDDLDHGAESINRADVGKYLADVVICAVRMANMMPGGGIDLEQAIADRLRDKFSAMAPIAGITETPHPAST